MSERTVTCVNPSEVQKLLRACSKHPSIYSTTTHALVHPVLDLNPADKPVKVTVRGMRGVVDDVIRSSGAKLV